MEDRHWDAWAIPEKLVGLQDGANFKNFGVMVKRNVFFSFFTICFRWPEKKMHLQIAPKTVLQVVLAKIEV